MFIKREFCNRLFTPFLINQGSEILYSCVFPVTKQIFKTFVARSSIIQLILNETLFEMKEHSLIINENIQIKISQLKMTPHLKKECEHTFEFSSRKVYKNI